MPIPAPLLKGITRPLPIERLFSERLYLEQHNALLNGERALIGMVLPPWQRPEVWTEFQKIRFMEGLFHGFGLGSYVINGMDWEDNGSRKPMAGWLIDGQQRISAIRDFVHERLVIFGDVTYESMTEAEKRRFMRRSFDCFELDYTSDEDKLKNLYDRLNFGGTPHLEHQSAGESAVVRIRHSERAM